MRPKTDGLKAGYDPQLKTPKHDELCLEYAKKENTSKILYQIKAHALLRIQTKKTLTNKFERIISNSNEIYYEFLGTTEEVKPITYNKNYIHNGKILKHETKYEIIKSTDELSSLNHWEHPIKARDFLIGVIDFRTDFMLTRKAEIKEIKNTYETEPISLSTSYRNKLDFTNSYNDEYKTAIIQQYKLINTEEKIGEQLLEEPMLTIFSEIKPVIDSIGEVMRQIKIYSSYIENPIFRYTERTNNIILQKNIALVTYGEKNRDLFEEQGFIYINLGEQPTEPKKTISDWVGDSNE